MSVASAMLVSRRPVAGCVFQAGSPFRQPLMKFLLRYPEQSVDLFLSDGKVQDQQWNRFFEVLTALFVL